MAKELRPIDISHMPDLLRIAEEVGASGTARLLRARDKDLAIVAPIARPARAGRGKRALSAKDREAFRSAAGGWKDVDTDGLLKDIYADRRAGDRPPVNL